MSNLQITIPASAQSKSLNLITPVLGMSINDDRTYKQIALGVDAFNIEKYSFTIDPELQEILDEEYGIKDVTPPITEAILRLYYEENLTDLRDIELEISFGTRGYCITISDCVAYRKAVSFEDWL